MATYSEKAKAAAIEIGEGFKTLVEEVGVREAVGFIEGLKLIAQLPDANTAYADTEDQ